MTLTLELDASLADSSTRRALSDISLAVAKCKKIVVVTGAGISCSCGIPDFRSSDGLYALVKQQYPDVVMKGRDLFDASLFRDRTSTSVFYTFISQLKRSIDSAAPAPTHRFIKTLDSKRKLLRSYTQNIDGFEETVGLCGLSNHAKTGGKGKSKLKTKDVRNVQLHGDIHRVRCTLCSADLPCTEEYLRVFDCGVPPDCPECISRSAARVARSARALKTGALRPAIVLYDEAHPLGEDIGMIQTADLSRIPDMLIIMGTSLKVHGLKKLVKDFARVVHGSTSSFTTNRPKTAKSWQGKVVFINKTPPGSEWSGVIDYHVSGETDQWVEKVIEDWKKMRPSDWEVQRTLDASGEFKVMKEHSLVVKGKPKHRRKSLVENVSPDDYRPLSTSVLKPPSSAPSSPNKRRQSISHHSDIESSPRKRRELSKISSCFEKLDMTDRRLLFVDTTNSSSRDITTGENTSGKVSRRPAGPHTLRNAASAKKHSRGRSGAEMWVEIKE
ncbi:DHS-like NAD/FAD-binding domain-containing protein [Phlebopus sp. FC_14]|nr:DHS-like NAD/FAD-binding domain-containing protein [Phlebopus sp. FC_14]